MSIILFQLANAIEIVEYSATIQYGKWRIYQGALFFFWQNHFYHLWDIICFRVRVSATSKVSPMHRYFFSPITCHHMPVDYVTFTNWISLSLLLHPYVLCYCLCSHVSTIKPRRHYNFWMDSWSSIAQYTLLLWADSCAFCAWWNYSLSFRLTFRRQLLQIFPLFMDTLN